MMSRYSATERIGINAVEAVVVNEFRWIFREQPIADMGIDAHVELVEDGNPTGKLMGLQIKTGRGNFHETKNAYVYYGDDVHLDYWTNHSLPVILVGHIPDTNETLWIEVSENTIEPTKKGWKVSLPKTAALDTACRADLTKLFEALHVNKNFGNWQSMSRSCVMWRAEERFLSRSRIGTTRASGAPI